MKANLGVRKALSLCLTLSIIATYSMVSLGNTPKFAGELLLSGKGANGSAPTALVNGETANSGRSIFSSSSVVTPQGVTATLNLGKAGIFQVAPNSSIKIAFDGTTVSGSIESGSIKVISAPGEVRFANAAGEAMTLLAGETAAANGKAQDDDDDDDNGGSAWWLWTAVAVGAGVGMIYFALKDSNSVNLGGNSTVISPNI